MSARAMSVGAVLTCAVLTGCGTAGPETVDAVDSSSPAPDGPSVQRASGAVAMISAEVDGVMDVSLSGIVVRTEDGCLALREPAGDIPVVWPHGAVLGEDGMSMDVPGFGIVAVGDEVWSGGGFLGPESGERIAPAVPAECATDADGSVAALQWFVDGPPSYDDASPADATGPSVQRAGGSVVMVSGVVESVMEASPSGVIVRTASGCLALDDHPSPVLWPHGSVLAADGLSVDVPGFGTVAVGDEIWATGGSIHDPAGHSFVPTVPEECVLSPDSGVLALQGFFTEPPADWP